MCLGEGRCLPEQKCKEAKGKHIFTGCTELTGKGQGEGGEEEQQQQLLGDLPGSGLLGHGPKH